ncbi:hypothetical protein BY458DRAFT_588349 [Sporodiniella umbellata]|nr:hypothetical protein BY458DRAFT_588349 [Sporodiniella umbellata]
MSTEKISHVVEMPVIQPAQPFHRRSFPICPNCNQSCFKNDGRFVKALNQVYHYQCFVCEDCSVSVADKYYCSIEEDNRRRRKVILCQHHYTKRANSVCPKCDQPCYGQKFHSDCIQCLQCPSSNSQTSFYDFNGQSYCREHYSLLSEIRCFGCNQAVLKQFVQHRDSPENIWHPECYMVYKFWGVKLAPQREPDSNELVEFQVAVEKIVNRVWIDLSSFEESAANCISDMLMNAASTLYSETIRAANQFAVHLEVLFNALDFIDRHLVRFGQSISCSKEADFVCNQTVQFLQLLDFFQEKSSTNMTQDLSSLVTGLAQNLKALIRIGLSTALHLEQELGIENAILDFLEYLLALEKKRVWVSGKYWFKDAPLVEERILTCNQCKLAIMQDYYTVKDKDLLWHRPCFQCSVCSSQIKEWDLVAFGQKDELVCCTTPDQPLYACTYVSFLQHLLYDLKFYLSQLSLMPQKKYTPASLSEEISTKESNSPHTPPKRRKSFLGLLTTKTQQKSPETQIRLGQIQSSRKNQDETGVRRAFSTNSNRSVSRKPSQRQPISSLIFRRQSKKAQSQARRASVFMADECILSWEPIQTISSSQDYILRHVAVMALQPLLAPGSNLDEYVDILDTEYRALSAHHPSALWGKLITHIRTKNTEHKIFGAPLSVLVNRDKEKTGLISPRLQNVSAGLTASFSESASIPIFVKSLISALLQTDMSVEGVFRKNGNIRQLNELAETLDQLNKASSDKAVDGTINSLLCKQSPIQLSALLKRYLRELPEPLLTFSFYKLFIQCNKTEGDNKRMLHMACCLLPKSNRDTMIMIFSCLKWIGSFSDANRMGVSNLACVVAPSVLYNKPCVNERPSELRQATHDEILVVERLIEYSDDMSAIPSGLTLLPLHDLCPSETSSKHFIKQYSQMLLDKHSNETIVNREKQKRLSWMLRRK